MRGNDTTPCTQRLTCRANHLQICIIAQSVAELLLVRVWLASFAAGAESSKVRSFFHSFKNPTPQYQSGIDFHFEWGASKFPSKQVFVGFVGYQVTDDFGQPAVSRRLSLARPRRRAADRVCFPDRHQSGISAPEGLWRVLCGQTAVQLERLADLCDLRSRADKHGDADKSFGEKIDNLAGLAAARPLTAVNRNQTRSDRELRRHVIDLESEY